MNISSPVFDNNQLIPARFTCDGESVAPHLEFEEVPPGTESLVLIVDDPDAPGGTFTHWLVWNIPPETKEIVEGIVPDGSVEGVNSNLNMAYQGPCPPSGTHRYFFDLYALDTRLNLRADSDRGDLEQEMNGHVLAKAELVGLYQRGG